MFVNLNTEPNKSFIKNKLLLILFVIAPFIHVFKLNFGNLPTYSIFIFILIILLIVSKSKLTSIFNINLTIFHLLFVNLIFVFLYHTLYYLENYLFYILFYGGNILFFGIFFLIDLKEFIYKYYMSLLQYYFIILFVSILLDYIIFKIHFNGIFDIGLIESSLMYCIDPATPYVTFSRPLGLFGQATVNSVILVFLFLLILAVDYQYKILKLSKLILYTIFVIYGVIIQGSATGVIMLIFSLFFIYASKKKIILFAFIFFLSYYFVLLFFGEENFIIKKMSYEYISLMVNIFYTEILSYKNYINNPMDVLLGVSKTVNLVSGELGFIKIIVKMGVLFFILYSILLYFLIKQSNNHYYRIALIAFVFGSLHVEAMFWSYFMLFLWSLVYYDILFIKRNSLN